MAANPIPLAEDAPPPPGASLSLVPRPESRGADLGPILALVLDSVSSPHTKRQYGRSLLDFAAWRAEAGKPFTRAGVMAWRSSMEAKGLSPSTVNARLAAIRKLASEAAANGLLDAGVASAIQDIGGAKQRGSSIGNWLSLAQAQKLIEAPTPTTLKGKRDRAALALLLGCGLRRSEVVNLDFERIQQRDGRWVIIDLRGKGGRVRSVPVPNWTKAAVDNWGAAAGLASGRILRAMNRYGKKISHNSLSAEAILQMAALYGNQIGVPIKPHDLRRTCAKLCRKAGGELEQIQLLLGHASIQTTERYLGTEQDFTNAPNDRMGLKWRKE